MDSGYNSNSSSSLNCRPQEEIALKGNEKWNAIDEILAELDRRQQKKKLKKTLAATRSANESAEEVQLTMPYEADSSKKRAVTKDSKFHEVLSLLSLYDSPHFTASGECSGGDASDGGAAGYMRQSSWPVPECTPVQPLQRAAPSAPSGPSAPSVSSVPSALSVPSAPSIPFVPSVPPGPSTPAAPSAPSASSASAALTATLTPPPPIPSTSTYVDNTSFISDANLTTNMDEEDTTRLEHLKILFSLPREVLSLLWHKPPAHKRRGQVHSTKFGCRFCRSNGEQHTFYMSHELKDSRGLVACPVLRAYVCARCGSTGDYAHTLRYCPFSTLEERLQSLGLNQGLRLASGRLRPSAAPEPGPIGPPRAVRLHAHLQPEWAALERKLSGC